MRFPSISRILNPQAIASGIVTQGMGVILFAAVNKFIPNNLLRWGIYIVAGTGFKMWYPITQQVLTATKLDQKIEQTF